MTRVLIVDDSSFFRKRMSEILSADKHIEVVGVAVNGKEAIDLVSSLRPDVVTMDIEMPVMDGITATKHIMETCPTPILMFSSLTTQGAKATLDAIDAGAVDFLPKNLSDISADQDVAKRKLCARVRIVGARGVDKKIATGSVPAGNDRKSIANLTSSKVKPLSDFDLVIIGTSTGGPAAIQKILASFRSDYPLPVIIVQHMPEAFTGPFAQRLNDLCKVHVVLAVDGSRIEKGNVYLAPGGHQLEFAAGVGGKPVLNIKRSDPDYTYKPCVDVTFTSAARHFDGNILAFVLTGMGSDGKEGAKILKSTGATIIAQDEATSIVYGMPMAVVNAGLADIQLSLPDIITMLSGN